MEDKKTIRDVSRRCTLVTLMGLPGSGKTTLCQKLMNYNMGIQTPEAISMKNTRKFILIQYDSFVPLTIQRNYAEHPNLAKILRSNFLQLISNFVQILLQRDLLTEHALESELSNEVDYILPRTTFSSILLDQLKPEINSLLADIIDIILLIDDNNYYKSMRNEFIQIAKSNNLGFCILYPTASIRVCQERNLQRREAEQVPSSVIDNMNTKLEEPNPLQNTADIFALQVSDVLDPSTHELILDTLLYSLKNPLSAPSDTSLEIAKSRRICTESEVHQADLILRKWIHKELLTLASFGAKKQEMKKKSQDLEKKKKSVLSGLRTGRLQVMVTTDNEFEFGKQILTLALLE